MATITRGATTLTPALVLGWALTRPTRSVVHEILGADDVDVTVRPHGPRAGTLRTFWLTHADATAAMDALAVPGGPWVWDVVGAPLTATVTGDLELASATDAARRWIVTVGVHQAAS